ncbi:sirohydrochlorin ferrochelatase [Anoxybacillus voinovskiensis]|uniref:Sirohydrochlorin ferrochelatase n=1 Tax=Anoxybacteroides voinovskiense TaxID=230470 RepID=A0A840DSZ3_9BACL|nr:sirohydrochlorin chelatase [Anoxybacillus voinovskiensis]MBB4073397.1 sirohydrochlorin ferrochelatase [Anoxybacillus voinovskiensis]GGJ61593.1 sirohydrochlorin ferrochelatase [Anoxybacillus voinovskiensis]
MQAILYICHGSRVAKAREEAALFIERCKQKIACPIQEIAFLEHAEPTIETSIDRCVQKGATSIIVVPILLLAAGHAKQDIPAAIERAKQRHPHLTFSVSEPFGVHDNMINIIMERILEQSIPVDERSVVLLVGRGSSDVDTKRDMEAIARKLRQRNIPAVEVCFLASAKPSITDSIQQLNRSSYETIFIVPYLLFTGVLMKKIEAMIQMLPQTSKRWIVCRYLGYHPLLEELVKEKVAHQLSLQKN